MLELTTLDTGTGFALGPCYIDPSAIFAVAPAVIGGGKKATSVYAGGAIFFVMESVELVMEKLEAFEAEEEGGEVWALHRSEVQAHNREK